MSVAFKSYNTVDIFFFRPKVVLFSYMVDLVLLTFQSSFVFLGFL